MHRSKSALLTSTIIALLDTIVERARALLNCNTAQTFKENKKIFLQNNPDLKKVKR